MTDLGINTGSADDEAREKRERDKKPNPMQEFIFNREHAEVYLLLDNVTTSANKSLPTLPPVDPEDGDKPLDLITQVSLITWPPDESAAQRAKDVATLMRAKNELNIAAAPATGTTIAFTILVAGEDGNGAGFRLFGRRRSPAGGSAAKTSSPIENPPGQVAKPPSMSRFSLAQEAYPNLERSARNFSRFLWGITFALIVWLIVTAGLSWEITGGNTILTQWVKLKQEQASIAKQLVDAVQADAKDNTNNAGSGRGPDSKRSRAPGGIGVETFCLNAPQTESCQRRRENQRELCITTTNLNGWLAAWEWLLHQGKTGPGPDCASTTDSDFPVNDQLASTFLTVLGGAVLPIFYGLLGAGAAVVRMNSARIKESRLSPRHFMLSVIQLALGAVIGGCVGLFVTATGNDTSSNTATTGLLGAVPLSASALCFIAGFGVDGVFQALEGLLARVFNVESPTAKPPAKP